MTRLFKTKFEPSRVRNNCYPSERRCRRITVRLHCCPVLLTSHALRHWLMLRGTRRPTVWLQLITATARSANTDLGGPAIFLVVAGVRHRLPSVFWNLHDTTPMSATVGECGSGKHQLKDFKPVARHTPSTFDPWSRTVERQKGKRREGKRLLESTEATR